MSTEISDDTNNVVVQPEAWRTKDAVRLMEALREGKRAQKETRDLEKIYHVFLMKSAELEKENDVLREQVATAQKDLRRAHSVHRTSIRRLLKRSKALNYILLLVVLGLVVEKFTNFGKVAFAWAWIKFGL